MTSVGTGWRPGIGSRVDMPARWPGYHLGVLGDLRFTYKLSRFREMRVHEDGLVIAPRWRKPVVRRWEQVTEQRVELGIDIRYESDVHSVVTWHTWAFRLDAAGEDPLEVDLRARPVRTIDWQFAREGIREDRPDPVEGTMYAYLAKRIAEAQLPGALATVRDGGSVPFGALTATPEGLSHGDQPVLPWERLHSVYHAASYSRDQMIWTGSAAFVIAWPDEDHPGPVSRWARVPSAEVFNLNALNALGRELRGGDHDRLPPWKRPRAEREQS